MADSVQVPTLTPGSRLGTYEIAARLGAGGMGEVYRAKDLKLGRDVAIKVLPPSFSTDPERTARFRREAQVLAALNHPHIAAIYGLEEANGAQFLILELVEGETLDQRIAKGALPVDEALGIAKQIAEALEAAHEKGIIHRDLKPSNIAVTPTGNVKVLDFGLAKLVESPPTSPSAISTSPTVASPVVVTGAGTLLGTAAYMSPEQAKGRDADRRSDVWSFGCVLFEMLTDSRPFQGDSVAETLASVLRAQPDWHALPASTPGPVKRLLRRALDKDQHRRLDSVAVARIEIEEALSGEPDDAGSGVRGTRTWRRAAPLGVAVLVGAILSGAAVWRAIPRPPTTVLRLMMNAPGANTLSPARSFVITPDGSRIVYRGGSQLLVRGLDQLQPAVLAEMEAPTGLFVSPDNEWVGVFDALALKKIALRGGSAVSLYAGDGTSYRGGTWAAGTIVFATSATRTGLLRISESGGEVSVVTTPDPARGEGDHLWPEALPDGRAVLFTIAPLNGNMNTARVAVLDLTTGERKVLVNAAHHARWLPTGHLVYASGGTLHAIRFDLNSRSVVGAGRPVLDNVATTAFGAAQAVSSENGILAYAPTGSIIGDRRQLVWVDRQGREDVIQGAPARPYLYPRVSPDGNRLVVASNDQELDLWLLDLTRPSFTRLTLDPAADYNPTWTPEGRLVFNSTRTGEFNLYEQAADPSAKAVRLTESPNQQAVSAIAKDGTIIFHEQVPGNRRDIMRRTPEGRVESLLATRFEERGAVVSPDGRWFAYESDSSGTGRFEVFVRPFHKGEGQFPVSTGGGAQPVWSPTGRELFYVTPSGALAAVTVAATDTRWSAGPPSEVVRSGYFTAFGLANVSRHYDVSRDGSRFLMLKPTGDDGASAQIIVVQNWFEELKRLVPIN